MRLLSEQFSSEYKSILIDHGKYNLLEKYFGPDIDLIGTEVGIDTLAPIIEYQDTDELKE